MKLIKEYETHMGGISMMSDLDKVQVDAFNKYATAVKDSMKLCKQDNINMYGNYRNTQMYIRKDSF